MFKISESNMNKKAMDGLSFIMTAAIVILLVIVSAVLVNKANAVTRESALTCEGNKTPGAYCNVVADCGDNAYLKGSIGCPAGKYCCVPANYIPEQRNKAQNSSPECINKIEGEKCNSANQTMTLAVCDNTNGMCIPKCVYCANNPGRDICKGDNARPVSGPILTFNASFSCGCSISECNGPYNHTCVKKMCPLGNPDTYCCVK